MNDWLNEMQKFYECHSLSCATRGGANCNCEKGDFDKLARVLRELAGGFQSFEEIPGGNPMFSISALIEAYNNLSDDAKELLNES